MKILIELEQNFGHPNNARPTKQHLIQEVMKQLPPKLETCKGAFEFWQVSSVRVEGQ